MGVIYAFKAYKQFDRITLRPRVRRVGSSYERFLESLGVYLASLLLLNLCKGRTINPWIYKSTITAALGERVTGQMRTFLAHVPKKVIYLKDNTKGTFDYLYMITRLLDYFPHENWCVHFRQHQVYSVEIYAGMIGNDPPGMSSPMTIRTSSCRKFSKS